MAELVMSDQAEEGNKKIICLDREESDKQEIRICMAVSCCEK